MNLSLKQQSQKTPAKERLPEKQSRPTEADTGQPPDAVRLSELHQYRGSVLTMTLHMDQGSSWSGCHPWTRVTCHLINALGGRNRSSSDHCHGTGLWPSAPCTFRMTHSKALGSTLLQRGPTSVCGVTYPAHSSGEAFPLYPFT